MGSSRKAWGAALALAAVSACRVGSGDDVASAAIATDDIAGTYFAADSGHNLGKDWCYSGALVLDSTKHFGSVIKLCSDEGGPPVTESIKGTYHFRTRTVRVDGRTRERALYVVLEQDGRHGKTHTLRYANGTLRFDEPWWMGAGLRALEIPDPVLRKVTDSVSTDSTRVASSTPAAARASLPTKAAAKKSTARSSLPK